jgi:uncharacterized membrane protein
MTILLGSLAALYRRVQLSPAARFPVTVRTGVIDWWATQDRVNRIVYLILILALSAASLSFLVMASSPGSSDYFTEFYLLGPQDQAEGFPRNGQVGQPVSLIAGVKNRESAVGEYQIEIRQDQQLLEETASFRLNPGETLEGPLEFTPVVPGENVEIRFLLFRNGEPEPYRSLRLWMKVSKDG